MVVLGAGDGIGCVEDCVEDCWGVMVLLCGAVRDVSLWDELCVVGGFLVTVSGRLVVVVLSAASLASSFLFHPVDPDL